MNHITVNEALSLRDCEYFERVEQNTKQYSIALALTLSVNFK